MSRAILLLLNIVASYSYAVGLVIVQEMSMDAQLGVVADPQTRKELTYDKMVRQAKKYGLESKDDQGGVNALLLKEVEIASIAGEQDPYGDLLVAIATHKASL